MFCHCEKHATVMLAYIVIFMHKISTHLSGFGLILYKKATAIEMWYCVSQLNMRRYSINNIV